MKAVLNALNRAYARPPLSWLVNMMLWLGAPMDRAINRALRPYRERRAVELEALADRLAASGLATPAADLRLAAERSRMLGNQT